VQAAGPKRELMPKTLYQKYGGFAAVSRVVLAFYDKALDSDQIGDFFEDVDIKRLIDHQTKFISSLLGGPASYTRDRLGQIHARLNISDPDMDEMAKLLAEALDEHGFEPSDRDAVIHEIEALRSSIVSQAPR
jgi:hemoglobin